MSEDADLPDLALIRALCPGATFTAYHAKAEWLAAHRSPPLGLGGSEAAIAVGASPWDTPLGLWARKRGLAPPVEERRVMRLGAYLEAFVADEYVRETGRTLLDPGRWTLARSVARPSLLGSVDRIIDDPERGPGVLEIKTTGAHRAHEWEDGEIPREVAIQLAHYLALLELEWGGVAVLVGNDALHWCDVVRDRTLEAELLASEAAFLATVASGDDPPMAQAADSAVVKALYPKPDRGAVVALPGKAITWDVARLEAKECIAEATTRKDAAENALKQAIGEAEVGVLPNGIRYTWRQTATGRRNLVRRAAGRR